MFPPSPLRPISRQTARSVRRGFTLVEVIMAVTVLALVLVTSITTIQRAMSNLDSARSLETASRIMQCEIEKERLFTWTAVSNASYAPAVDAQFLSDPSITSRFTLSRSLTTVANHNSLMVQVTLRVAWRSYDGRNLNRTLTTYFTKGGLNDYIYNQT